VIAVQKFLDNGEDVFTRYTNVSFSHCYILVNLLIMLIGKLVPDGARSRDVPQLPETALDK